MEWADIRSEENRVMFGVGASEFVRSDSHASAARNRLPPQLNRHDDVPKPYVAGNHPYNIIWRRTDISRGSRIPSRIFRI